MDGTENNVEKKSHNSSTHTREQIAKMAGVGTGTLAYETKEEVMEWMFDIQLGRRNLSPLQRIAVIEKKREYYERKAKENQTNAGKNYGIGMKKLVMNSSQPISDGKERNPTVRKILSDMAGVSEDTYTKGKNSKLRALISNNFGRRKNDPSKDRKALATYVELKGNNHGGNRKSRCQNGTLNLDEIAKELNMSKRNLKRA